MRKKRHDTRAKEGEDFPNWHLLSRALSNHDPETVYTLLAERYPPPIAGRALVALIRTEPNWPKADNWHTVHYEQELSHRELQVLRCAERGLTILDTARELILGLETVKSHRTRILIKLGAKTIGEAVHIAHGKGLIE